MNARGGEKRATGFPRGSKAKTDDYVVTARRPHPPGSPALPRTTAACAGSTRRQPRLQVCRDPFPSIPARIADWNNTNVGHCTDCVVRREACGGD